MPSGMHAQTIGIPLQEVWSFVSDMNNWAPLVPGYMEHQMINERRSTWKFKGEVGIVQKVVHLQVDITNWQEPSKVSFDLTGLNEKVNGKGYFNADTIDENTTNITGHIDIAAKGIMAPVMNPVLKSLVPKTTKQLTEAVVNKMKASRSVAAT